MREAKILVVEDDDDIRDSLKELLEEEGYQVDTAANGEQALNRLRGEAPQLILLDLMMPVMDGWEFAERIRGRPDWAQIPVIVLSADRNIGDKARKLGAVGYLAKPFELSELLSLVQTSLTSIHGAGARDGHVGPGQA